MNHIYRVVFNAQLGLWQAVCECARACGGGGGSSLRAGAGVRALSALAIGLAGAWLAPGTAHAGGDGGYGGAYGDPNYAGPNWTAGTLGGDGGHGGDGFGSSGLGGVGGTGATGSTVGTSGANGLGDTGGGGGGGGGGATGALNISTLAVGSSVTGGTGGQGAGSAGGGSGGGGGGGGGAGVVMSSGSVGSLQVNGSVTGGNGGGGPVGFGLSGGGGGAGIMANNSSVTVASSAMIKGGNGGATTSYGFYLGQGGTGEGGALGARSSDGGIYSAAQGGAGITGTNLNLTVAGNVYGGMASDGRTRAAAVQFHGGTANVLTLQQGYQLSGGIVLDAGGVQVTVGNAAGTTQTLGSTIAVGSGSAVMFNGANEPLTVSGVISGAGGVVQNGTGTTVLGAANSYSGGTTINGGTLSLTGSGTLATTGVVNLGGSGATFDISSASGARTIGALSGVGGTVALGSNALTLGDGSSTTFAGAITGNSGSLVRQGASGSTTLTGISTYTGGTAVQSGTLGIDGSVQGNVAVNNGATLAGNGSIGGTVTVANGAHLAPGSRTGSAALGTLRVGGDLTIQSGAQLDFRLGAPGSSFATPGSGDSVAVTGNLNIASSTLNVTYTGAMGAGVYNLFSWGQALSMTGGGFAVPTGTSLQVLAIDRKINLVTTAGQTLNFWNADGLASSTQSGGGSGTWSNTANIWADATGAITGSMTPQPGFAVFGGAAGTVTVDNSPGQVAVTGMQFASDGYRLTGGPIALVGQNGGPSEIRVGDGSAAGAGWRATIDNVLTGTAGLNVTDAGELVLNATNTYSGGTNVSAGTLVANSNQALGTGGVTVDNAANAAATLQVNSGKSINNSVTVNNGGTLNNEGALRNVYGTAGSATINNSNGGAIASLSFDAGIKLSAGGTINNSGTGPAASGSKASSISGFFGGVLIEGGAGTLTNTGGAMISGGGAGVSMQAGGTLSNDGAGSKITGGFAAVAIGGKSGEVTNSGGAQISGGGNGVQLQAGGSVTNTGAGSLIQGATGGVNVLGASGTVTNINGAAINEAGSSAVGVNLGAGGSVINGVGSTIHGGMASIQATGVTSVSNAGTLNGSVTLDSAAANQVTLFTGSKIYSDNGTGTGTAIGTADLNIGSNTASTLTLDGTGSNQRYSDAVTGATTFAGALTKQGTGSWTLDRDLTAASTTISAGTLQLGNGGITGSVGAGAITNNGTLVVNRSDDLSMSNAISGAGGLVKQGGNVLTLTGANSSTGGTDIQAGTLALSGTGGLGSGALALSGATAELDIAAANSQRSVGELNGVGGSQVQLGGNSLTVGGAGNGSFAGAIHGTGSLTKNGAGTQTLTGANDFTGGTQINAGTLVLSGAGSLEATGALNLDPGGTFDISDTNSGSTIGALTGAAGSSVALGDKTLTLGGTSTTNFAGNIAGVGGALVKQGAGTQTLTGVNSYTGGTTINAGTLALGAGGSLASMGAVNLASSGTSFDIRNAGANQTIGALSGVAGSQVQLGSQTLSFGDGSDQTLAGAIHGTGGIVKQGAGVQTLTGGNDFTGGTTVSAGTLALSGAGSLAAMGALNLDPGGTFDISATNSGSTIGALTGAAGSSVALGDKTLTLGGASTTNFAGNIAGVGGALVKQGAGTQTLTGTNSYTGGTTINAGTLALGAGGSLSSSGAVTLANAGTSFDISNASANQTISALSGVAGSQVQLGSQTLSFGDGNNKTMAGAIHGTGGIVKQGAGVQTLTGANDFTGGTELKAGTLALGVGGSLVSSGAVNLTGSGAAFDISAAGANQTVGALSGVAGSHVQLGGQALSFGDGSDQTLAGAIHGTGGIVKQGAGVQTLTGANDFTGGTVINAGTLALGAGGALASSGAVNLAAAGTTFDIGAASANQTVGALSGAVGSQIQLGSRTLSFGDGSDQTLASAIHGTGGIVKQGAGVQTLTGANDFTGGATINAGTLQVDSDARLGASAGALSFNGGTLQTTATIGSQRQITLGASGGTFSPASNTLLTLAGNIQGAGGLTKAGAGTLTLAGQTQYSGDTAVNAGTLNLAGSSHALGGNLGVASGAALGLASSGTVTVGGSVRLADASTLSISALPADLAAAGLKASAMQIGQGVDFNLSGISAANEANRVLIDTTAGISGDFTRVSVGGFSGPVDYMTLSTGKSADGLQYLASYALSWTAQNSGAHGTFTLGNIADRFTVSTSLGDQAPNSSLSWDGKSLTKAGDGTLVLDGANSYTGTTTISGGTLQIGNGANSGSLGTGAVINNGTLVFNRSDAYAVVNDIQGAGGLSQIGSGTTVLTGSNTYQGGTRLNGGTLEVDSDARLGAASGALSFNGGTLQTTASTTSQRQITLEANGGSFSPDVRTTLTLNGAVQGAGGLSQTGAGTLVMTGNNSYVGDTRITLGTLQVGAGGTSGTLGAGGVTNNGALVFDRSDSSTVANAIGGAGSLTQQGTGTTVLTGSNTYQGQTTIAAGTLQVGNGGTSGTLGTGGVSNNGALVFDRSDSSTVANAISGTGSLTQQGTGTTVLTGSNTYQGQTTIGAGALQLGDGGISGTLGTGSVTNNGMLALNRSDTSIIANAISGAGNLSQQGAGTTVLTGSNTYRGQTTITAGALQVGNGGTTGTLGAGDVINNGALVFDRSDSSTVTNAISGTGSLMQQGAGTTVLTGGNTYQGQTTITAGTLQVGDGGTTGALGTGRVLNDGALVFDRSDSSTVTNAINGTGSLVQQGTGTTVLAGNNSYSGGTTINSGTLQVGSGGTSGTLGAGNVINNGALVLNRSDASIVAAGISGTGSLTQQGTGATVLAGYASYGGNTAINAGTLSFAGGAALSGDVSVAAGATLGVGGTAPVSIGGAVNLANASSLAISSQNAGPNLQAGSLSLGLGSGVMLNLSGISAPNELNRVLISTTGGIRGDFANVTVGGFSGPVDYLTLNTGKSANGLQYLASYNLSWMASNPLAHGTFTLNNASDQFEVGVGLSNQMPNSALGWDGQSLTKNGTGTLILSGANSYTGTTIINGGTLQIGNGGNSGNLGAGAVFNSGTLAFNRSDSSTVGNDIQGVGGLSQIGTGTTVLTGSNSYQGGTSINDGTLQVNSDARLGAASGALSLNGGTLQTTASTSTERQITLGSNGGSFSADAGTTLSIQSSVQGVGGLTQAGNGTLVLAGNNSYSGGTTINSGTLQVGNGGTSGTLGAGNVSNNGTLVLDRSDEVIIANVIDGTGSLIQQGTGTVALTGNNNYSGTTTIASGMLQVGAGGTSGTLGTGAITNNGVLSVDRSDAFVLAQNISGTGALQQVGSGTTTLTGSNSYTGGTVVAAGTLKAGSANALVQNTVYYLNEGSTLDLNSHALQTSMLMGRGNVLLGSADLTVSSAAGQRDSFGGQIAGTGQLIKQGEGTLALNNASSFTGGVCLKQGRINLGNERGLGTGILSMDDGTSLGLTTNGMTVANNLVMTGSNDPIIDTGANSASWTGAISGAGFLTKQGAGVLTLSSTANDYTGATHVAEGTLQAGAVNTFSSASVHNVATGAVLDLAGYSQTLSSLTNSGTVNLSSHGSGTPGTVLKVTGPYVGNGGTLGISTVLAADGSASDKLLMSGANAVASGSTTLQVTNAGGLGAQTTGNGIEVIATENGASLQPGSFTLAGGHVDAGAYEYRLFQTAQGASLQSTNTQLAYRSEVPLVSALPAQLRQSDAAMMGDLRKRMGDDNVTGTAGSGAVSADAGFGRRAWGRILRTDPTITQQGTVSPQSSGHMTGFQAGLDLYASQSFKGGFYVGQLQGDMSVTGFAGGINNKAVGFNSLTSRYLGLYGTWQNGNGLYADAVLQGADYRSNLHTSDNTGAGASSVTNGTGVLASMELGQAFALGSHWQIEPQAQISYRNINLHDSSMSLAQVKNKADSDWTLRLGARIRGSFATSVGQFQPYGRVNVYKASNTNDVASFITPAATTQISAKGGYTATELAAGASLQLNKSTSIYGELGKLWANGGDSRVKSGVQASVGLRVQW